MRSPAYKMVDVLPASGLVTLKFVCFDCDLHQVWAVVAREPTYPKCWRCGGNTKRTK